MFAQPPDIRTEIFARLPDSMRRPIVMRFGVPRDSFLEGPSFDVHGNLYCCDTLAGRVYRITPDGIFHLAAEYDGEPGGLKIHADGCCFLTCRKYGIAALDPSTGKVTPVVSGALGEPFRLTNDLAFATNGDLYFTDQGAQGIENPVGRIFVLRAGGRLELLLDRLPGPNGLVLTPDGRHLLIALTRANCVVKAPLDINPDGSVTRVGVFVQMSGGIGPDGLAMCEDGSFVVCHHGLGSAWLFDPYGEPLARIRSCAGRSTTNLAFGGPERRHVYITESDTGQILRAEIDRPGARMFSHMR